MSFIWMVGGAFEPFQVIQSKPRGKIQPAGRTPKLTPAGGEGSDSGGGQEFAQARKAYEAADQQGRSRKPAVLARDIMSSPVESLPPGTSVEKAREFIRHRRFHHVPVKAKTGLLVGILSDRDLLRGTPHPEHSHPRARKSLPPKTVKDLMSTKVLTATADTPIREIARVFVEERIGCLPILTPEKEMLGILTTTDILRCLINVTPLDLWT